MIYKPHVTFLILVLYLLCLVSVGLADSPKNKEYLIRISDDLSGITNSRPSKDRTEFLKQSLKIDEDSEIVKVLNNPASKLSKWYLLKINPSLPNQILAFRENQDIEIIQENNHLKIHDQPVNDSLYSEQWYHRRIGTLASWKNFSINPDVLIAIIDTGIDYKHPDLEGSIWINSDEDLNGNGRFDPEDQNNIDDDDNGYIDDVMGWDFTDAPRLGSGGDDTDPDNDPMDEYSGGHGTKIAGIIAAQTNNYHGISGLIPGIKVMNLRAGTASGYLEEDDVARAVLYAINNGARIINMSFGDVVLSRFLKDVIEYAYKNEIIIVASSGNSGNDLIHYPSGLAETISVGATDQDDSRANFSNFGGTIDLVAPGVDILSTNAGGGYGMAGGTSFSAPMVAATAALLLSNNDGLSVEQVRNSLKTSSEDIGVEGWDPDFGSGRLQMERASLLQKESSLVIHYPLTGSHTREDTIVIIATAYDPDLISLDLSYGLGENPVAWKSILPDYKYQIINDTLANLAAGSIEDGALTIRLRSQTWDGSSAETRSIINLDRTKPQIEKHTATKQLDGRLYSYLLNFETDDVCTADIFIRTAESNENFTPVRLSYEANKHYYLFSPDRDVEYYLKVTNYSGLDEIDNNGGAHYNLKSIRRDIITDEFVLMDYTLPSGYLLPEATDFDQDGRYEIVISEYDENRNFGPVAVYELNNGKFVKQMETSFKAIPRSFGDADGDGNPELLLGYGQKSYLLEATEGNSWAPEIVWSDSAAFWASKITDLDNDGIYEILGKEGQDFVLYESVGDNAFAKTFTFSNQSEGDNQLGPPRTEVADLDNDGFLEVYFGDYDGDIIAYENNANNSYVSRGSIKLPLRDATNFFTGSKHMLPTKRSLVAGSHTETNLSYEHEFAAQYWSYSVIVMNSDNSFEIRQEIPVYGFADLRDFEAGCNTAALGDDGEEYVFLAPYPDLYVFKSYGDSLVPVWYHENVNTNTILVHDFDQDGKGEFFFNVGDQIVAYSGNLVERPLAPGNLQVYPLNQSSIYLTWQMIPLAEKYIIYRGDNPDNLTVYDSTLSDTYYMDTDVVEGGVYYYALRTFAASFEQNYSHFTDIISATPNKQARVDTLLAKNERQIELYFTEKMDIDAMYAVNFSLIGEDNPTTSAISFFDGRAVLLSFSEPFEIGGVYDLMISAVRDTNRTPLYEEDAVQTFIYRAESNDKPYVREWFFEGRGWLILKFNMPMNNESVTNPDNYGLEPSGSVEGIEPLGTSSMEYRINFSDDTYSPGSGITTYLVLKGIENARGELLDNGNRIALVESVENIDNILVYPQPLNPDKEWLMFANIGSGTEIKIFDVNGHFVIGLKEGDRNGGIKWDLTDSRGQKVSSGIYLYQAIFENQKKLGKLTIIR